MQRVLHGLQFMRFVVHGLERGVRVLADGLFSEFNVLQEFLAIEFQQGGLIEFSPAGVGIVHSVQWALEFFEFSGEFQIRKV